MNTQQKKAFAFLLDTAVRFPKAVRYCLDRLLAGVGTRPIIRQLAHRMGYDPLMDAVLDAVGPAKAVERIQAADPRPGALVAYAIGAQPCRPWDETEELLGVDLAAHEAAIAGMARDAALRTPIGFDAVIDGIVRRSLPTLIEEFGIRRRDGRIVCFTQPPERLHALLKRHQDAVERLLDQKT